MVAETVLSFVFVSRSPSLSLSLLMLSLSLSSLPLTSSDKRTVAPYRSSNLARDSPSPSCSRLPNDLEPPLEARDLSFWSWAASSSQALPGLPGRVSPFRGGHQFRGFHETHKANKTFGLI